MNARYISLSTPVLLVALTTGCNSSDDTTHDPEPVPPRPVKTQLVSSNSGNSQRILSASTISEDNQNLSFRVPGIIVELPVAVGQELSQGDLIARLDPTPFQLGVKEASASVATADAGYKNANSNYTRTRELYTTEAASLADLENARANAASARANLSLAREGLNSAKLNLGYTELHSPTSRCQVVDIPAAKNQNISAGQTIVTTACGEHLRVRSVVPENLIDSIELGMPVIVTLSAGGGPMNGTVAEIGVSTSNSSGYEVEVELQDPPSSWRVGMTGEITLDLAGTDNRIVLPLFAVIGDAQGKFVYILEPQDEFFRVVRQAVETGELDNDGIEIISGLSDGMRVVTGGMSRISEDMIVDLWTETQQ